MAKDNLTSIGPTLALPAGTSTAASVGVAQKSRAAHKSETPRRPPLHAVAFDRANTNSPDISLRSLQEARLLANFRRADEEDRQYILAFSALGLDEPGAAGGHLRLV